MRYLALCRAPVKNDVSIQAVSSLAELVTASLPADPDALAR